MNGKTYILENGTILDDRYAIREVIGEGGFGITYAGENERIGLKVAIKEFFCRDYMGRNTKDSNEIFLTDESAEERFEKEKQKFLKEARILSDFSSENGIVHVNDYFEDNGTAYIVMSFLTGTTLKDYVKKNGPMDAETLFARIKPLMQTLGRVHKAGLVHRDISPDNIMMLEDGSFCLIDFGAAMSYNAAEKSFTMICKRSYAAPEMYNLKGELDPRADVYSLSATLYYCLTGKDPEDSLQRILMDELEPVSRLNPEVPAETEKLITKGLSLSAGERYADTEEYLASIEAVYPEKRDEPKKKLSKKAIVLIVIAAVLVAAIAAGLLYYLPRRTELRFKNIDTDVVWLYMDEGLSAQDYNYSKEVIRERLEIFAGKNNYLWEEQDDKIRMEFPVEVLAGHDPARATRAYLSRAYDLYLVKENNSLEQVQTDAVAVAREDLASVELLNGQIEGLEREKYNLPENGDYRYFKIALSENAAKTFNEQYDKILFRSGEDFLVFYDLFAENVNQYFYDFCVSCGDGRSFYLINCDLEGNYLDVLNYTLTHPASVSGFNVAAEPVVDWEQKESSWIFGENQVNETEIREQYYLLQYSFYNATKETKGAWAHNMIAFKERLDALQIPYAFGLMEYDDSTFVLKLRKEDVFRETAELLCAYGSAPFAIKTKWENLYSPIDTDLFSWNPDSSTLSTAIYKFNVPDVKELASTAISNGDTYAYLTFENHPIARIPLETLTRLSESGEIEIRDFLFDTKTPFMDFLIISMREKLDSNGTLDAIYLKDENEDSFTSLDAVALPTMFESIYPDDEQIKTDMKKFAEENGGKATFEENSTGVSAKFWFFDVNKKTIIDDHIQFEEKLFSQFEKPLSDGDIYSILIYFDINEDGNTDRERLGISFAKSTSARAIKFTMIYNQNLGLNDEKVLETFKNAYRNSPVLSKIDITETSVFK